jgi:hypothetical protein
MRALFGFTAEVTERIPAPIGLELTNNATNPTTISVKILCFFIIDLLSDRQF